MDLDALEFLRRFLQHVLPPRLQKVRHYGFLSPQSAVSLDDVRALLAAERPAALVPGETPAPDVDSSAATPEAVTEPTCAYCGHRLRVVALLLHQPSFCDSG